MKAPCQKSNASAPSQNPRPATAGESGGPEILGDTLAEADEQSTAEGAGNLEQTAPALESEVPARPFAETIPDLLITPGEMAELRTHAEEMERRMKAADAWLPELRREAHKAAKAAYESNPTAENLSAFEAIPYPNGDEERQRCMKMARAGVVALGAYYDLYVLPILRVIFSRAHARWSAEIERQKQREEEWKKIWATWATWSGYYGCNAPEFQSIVPSIAHRAMSAHSELNYLALWRGDNATQHKRPPSIEANLNKLGLSLHGKASLPG